MTTEIGRIIISLCLLGLAGFLFSWGITAPEAAQAVGCSGIGGAIIGALLTYWLKPG